MRILGIDPGYAIIGFSILDTNNTECNLVESGSIQPLKNSKEEARLVEIKHDLQEVIEKYKPDCASVEKLFYFKNQKTVISVAQARGVILSVLGEYNIPVFEYTPLEVKMSVTGYGRATKDEVAVMTRKFVNYEKFPKLDDTVDSIAIALCYLRSEKNGVI